MLQGHGAAQPRQHHLREYRCQGFHFCHCRFEIQTTPTVFLTGFQRHMPTHCAMVHHAGGGDCQCLKRRLGMSVTQDNDIRAMYGDVGLHSCCRFEFERRQQFFSFLKERAAAHSQQDFWCKKRLHHGHEQPAQTHKWDTPLVPAAAAVSCVSARVRSCHLCAQEPAHHPPGRTVFCKNQPEKQLK